MPSDLEASRRPVVEGPPDDDAPARSSLPPARALRREVWWVAAALIAVEMAVSARYGFHRDELYFIACGHHLAFGYVDQPPLAPALTRLSTSLFGTSPSAVRFVPALAGAAVVVGTGLTTGALGGGRFAQVLAAVAMACAPITLGAAHLAGTTIFDVAAWTFTVWLVILAVLRERPGCWLAAGAVAGLGLENKELILLLLLAVAVGLLCSSRRIVLATPWPWAGLGIAAVLWAPNLIWQLSHGLPVLAMSSALRSEHSAVGDYVAFLPAQFVLAGLFSAPLVVVGIVVLARRRDLRFMALAAAIVTAYVFAVIPGRVYYTAGLLPLVLALGATRVEVASVVRLRRRLWLFAPAAGLVLTAAIVLPVLPLAAFAKIPSLHKISYDLGETVGWPQLTRQVAAAYDTLPASERRQASIFTSNYGEAGAIALYGPPLELPTPLSGHNTYWLWGPGRAPDQVVLAVGSVDQLRGHFATCVRDATIRSPLNVNNDENGTQLWVCRHPQGPWPSFWQGLRHYN